MNHPKANWLRQCLSIRGSIWVHVDQFLDWHYSFSLLSMCYHHRESQYIMLNSTLQLIRFSPNHGSYLCENNFNTEQIIQEKIFVKISLTLLSSSTNLSLNSLKMIITESSWIIWSILKLFSHWWLPWFSTKQISSSADFNMTGWGSPSW